MVIDCSWPYNLSSGIMAVMSGTEYQFDLSGGDLALDFVNTLGGMRGVRPNEHLHAYGDLLAFAQQAGALSGDTAAALLREAQRHPAEAEALLREAKALREVLYRLFLATATCEPARDEDLAILNRALGGALAHRRLVVADGTWAMGWEAKLSLEVPLWPILEAAAALLVSADLSRVRVCGMYDDHECSWIFVDRTKARTRRWCSMKECGNRAKARRHYHRKRAQE